MGFLSSFFKSERNTAGTFTAEPPVNMLEFAAVGRTKPLSFEEAYVDLMVLNQRQVFELTKNLDTCNTAAAADIKRVEKALVAYEATRNLPEALRKSILVQFYLRRAYKAAKAIERHPYTSIGRSRHVSIAVFNAVLQVQDNSYAYMIKPGHKTNPASVFKRDSVKLQPRDDFLKALVVLENTTALLEKSLTKFDTKSREKEINKANSS